MKNRFSRCGRVGRGHKVGWGRELEDFSGAEWGLESDGNRRDSTKSDWNRRDGDGVERKAWGELMVGRGFTAGVPRVV